MSYLWRRQRHISFSQRAKTITRSIALIIITILVFFAVPVKAQVPVSLMPVVRQQFFGSSGLPLAGGLVYTYVAGTSTPAPTYLDSTGTSQNTNPITLDGGGFAAIWIPAAPIDVAVFNSSGTQQYKVLNVTALPLVVTSLTANFFQSATTNPALSGFLRMASSDQVCWRNNGNSADLCLNKDNSDNLFFGSNQFAYTNQTNNWTALQDFAGFCWNSNTLNYACLTHADTAARTYVFPDASGNVCISTSCGLTSPAINGVTITGAPTGAGQTIVSTSSTAATWGLGAITDYDSYSPNSLINIPIPVTTTLQTLPIGAVENTGPVGSFIDGEVVVNGVSYSGSAPVLNIDVNGVSIGSVTLATSTSYDIHFSVALSSTRLPQATLQVFASTPGLSTSTYTQSGIAVIDGTAPVVFTGVITTATTVSLAYQLVHVRVRQ